MSTILESLFYHGIHPFEEIVPQDPEYRAIHRQIGELRQHFEQKLDPEDARRLEEMGNLYLQSGTLLACASFAHGFRLATLLLGEAWAGEK